MSKFDATFDLADVVTYGYNARNELTNAVAAVDSNYRYAYDFDDIGNRKTSSERGTNFIYTANNLNQYTAVDDFTPHFDFDGNQTHIKTATGVWHVSYNGENRPDLWSNGTTNITMKFDRMGRRVEYIETVGTGAEATTNAHHRFVYDGYLCIQRLNAASNNAIDLIFAWNPVEPVATRPLMIERPNVCMLHVTHDGNKNVSDLVVISVGSGIAAHYDYSPFGVCTGYVCNTKHSACDFGVYNPFRFSSEYADDSLGLVYCNYRHYVQDVGRWNAREPWQYIPLFQKNSFFDGRGVMSTEYIFCKNCDYLSDALGLIPRGTDSEWGGFPDHVRLSLDDEDFKGHFSAGNCWRYACNDPMTQPFELLAPEGAEKVGRKERHQALPPGWEKKGSQAQCLKIRNEILKKYGSRGVTSCSGECDECHYKVYLALKPEVKGWFGTTKESADFHWYRQDTDSSGAPTGTWSSKGGTNPIASTTDPVLDARQRGYTIDCGYLCFPNKGINSL